jgi:hypothetical protein
VFTEDGATQAHDSCTAALRHALLVVEPATRVHRVDFEPGEDEAKRAAQANSWRSRTPRYREARIALARTIASRVSLQDPPGFVVFHHDGDVPWSERPSPHAAPFRELVVAEVRRQLEFAGTPPERIDALLRRLHTMVPHYSIEAWAYQNLARVRALVEGHEPALRRCQSWSDARERLDELVKPKDALPIRDEHNAELLGKGWPRDVVHGTSPSFTAFCDELRRDDDLTAALRATWDDPAA